MEETNDREIETIAKAQNLAFNIQDKLLFIDRFLEIVSWHTDNFYKFAHIQVSKEIVEVALSDLEKRNETTIVGKTVRGFFVPENDFNVLWNSIQSVLKESRDFLGLVE